MSKASPVAALLILLVACSAASGPAPKVRKDIPFKAAIIYTLGGAQAVAREDFKLLDRDAVELWREAGLVKDENNLGLQFDMDRYFAQRDKTPSKYDLAVASHVIRSATTDFEGAAKFEDVPDGTFYIYGVAQTRTGYAVWSYKVSSGEGQTVLLDNKNAVFAR